MGRTVYPGEFYRHFKNKLYQIVAVAEHSETGEQMVVYQALYGDYRVYVRPYEMFTSEVDHEKYPDAGQQYRFERVALRGCTPENEPGRLPGHTSEDVPGRLPGHTSEDEPGRLPGHTSENVPGQKTEQMPEKAPNPEFLRFLEAESFEERMECLKKLSQTATQSDLDSLYLVLDMKPQPGTVREQVERIAQHLSVQNRYDGRRLR